MLAGILVSCGLAHAQETWLIGPRQHDRGAVEELLERASALGARVWRDGASFLIGASLGDLPRETGVVVEPFTGGDRDDIVQTTDFAPVGSLRGSGEIVTLDHAENAAFLGASFLLDRVENVAWAADGTFILDSPYASGSSARALNFARQFGLRVTMVESARPAYELKRPRLGVAIQDEWIAALLDRYRVPYGRAARGDWGSKYDTILVSAALNSAASTDFAGTVIRLPSAQSGAAFVKVAFPTTEPVAFGMPREEWVHLGRDAPVMKASARTIARFADTQAAAIQEETSGKIRVLSFAFPPDTYATCKLLLNAIYLGSARKL